VLLGRWGSKFVDIANGTIPMEGDVVSFIFLSFVVHMRLQGNFLDDDVIQMDLTYFFSLKLHNDVSGDMF
jgi:hypothetical protein